MMINNNYAQAIAQAKANKMSVVNFDQKTPAVEAISGEKDTVTLSDKALAMMNGKEYIEQAPTYIHPVSSRSLLEASDAKNKAEDASTNENKVPDNRFADMMQNILDQRLGIDRKKLEEIEAMMEAVAKDDSLSPEARQEALEKLAEMKEKIFQESRDLDKIARKTD